jgi:hypothetical protein
LPLEDTAAVLHSAALVAAAEAGWVDSIDAPLEVEDTAGAAASGSDAAATPTSSAGEPALGQRPASPSRGSGGQAAVLSAALRPLTAHASMDRQAQSMSWGIAAPSLAPAGSWAAAEAAAVVTEYAVAWGRLLQVSRAVMQPGRRRLVTVLKAEHA